MYVHNFSFKGVSKEYKRFPHPGYFVTKNNGSKNYIGLFAR
jgi:hypothetical protein